jgi:hypothetical protein
MWILAPDTHWSDIDMFADDPSAKPEPVVYFLSSLLLGALNESQVFQIRRPESSPREQQIRKAYNSYNHQAPA